MTTITIVGTGNMGQAIAGVLGNGGAHVERLGSDDVGGSRSTSIYLYGNRFHVEKSRRRRESKMSSTVPPAEKRTSPTSVV